MRPPTKEGMSFDAFVKKKKRLRQRRCWARRIYGWMSGIAAGSEALFAAAAATTAVTLAAAMTTAAAERDRGCAGVGEGCGRGLGAG